MARVKHVRPTYASCITFAFVTLDRPESAAGTRSSSEAASPAVVLTVGGDVSNSIASLQLKGLNSPWA